MKPSFHVGHDNAGTPVFSKTLSCFIQYTIPKNDCGILRELAKHYAELAANPVNRERMFRTKKTNDLIHDRPIVWIEEIPWHELNIDDQLTLRCDSEEGRVLEEFFRQTLFRWKYFQADMVVEDTLYILKSYSNSGIGIDVKEETLSLPGNNAIVSHRYEDQLDCEEKIERLSPPVIKAHSENDRQNLEICSEIFNGILPVKLRGHYVDYSPWEHIAEFRGVDKVLNDIIDNPELLHVTMKKFSELGNAFFDQFEAEGLLDYNIQKVHCTPGYTNILPAKDYKDGLVRFKDTWLRTRAQMFSMVSPSMRDEFDLQYIRPFMDRSGIVYYGCCEPLELCMPYLKQIPNLRKIGASPWANISTLAEQIGGDYVLARKPNPATVATVLNEETVSKEITETVEACIKNKCPYEFVFKDISTVGCKPENLFSWIRIVNQILDKYYT